MAVLVDACRRMLKRERDASALKTTDEISQWLDKHLEYSREILRPAASVLAACLKAKPEAVDVAVALFLRWRYDNAWGGGIMAPEEASVRLREFILAAAAAKGAA